MTLKISLPVKPLTVNKAWRSGPRYRTKEYLAYEKELYHFLPNNKITGEVQINYRFYIKNHSRTDVDNLIKALQDIITKKGIIEDDCKVMSISAVKIKSNEEKIEVEIEAYKEK